jgi:hypothetical protein
MKLSRLALGAALAFSLGAAPALASPAETTTNTAAVRGALAAFDLDLEGDRVKRTKTGKRDLIVYSAERYDNAVEALKQAHATRRALPNGLRITGWAFIDARQTFTFTFTEPATQRNYVAELIPENGATQILIRDSVFSPNDKRRSPHDLPRRFSTVKRSKVDRYAHTN